MLIYPISKSCTKKRIFKRFPTLTVQIYSLTFKYKYFTKHAYYRNKNL
jgi:hypothetical protein